MSYYVRFGKELRRIRRENGLTQKNLAEALGISQSILSSIERGKPKIKDAGKLDEILDLLGYSLTISQKKTLKIYA